MLLVASAAGLLGGCASEDNLAVGLNAACTRTKDCQPGLTCTGGVCSLADAGGDGGFDGAGLVDAAIAP
jgi:hypothetical protein